MNTLLTTIDFTIPAKRAKDFRVEVIRCGGVIVFDETAGDETFISVDAAVKALPGENTIEAVERVFARAYEF